MTEISANSIRLIATIFARPHFRQIAVTLLSVTALLASVFLYSRNNNFSSFYHPDERVKARQVGENKRLYLHPQLLLEATDLALKISRHQASETLESLHKVILTGRWVSAILAGLTVVALGLVGYFYAGFGGLVLGALSVGLCPSLLINAHYMKEDTALVFGIALTLLAALIYSRAPPGKRQVAALLFLGAAAGIAASGKYIGIIALAAALLFVCFLSPSRELSVRCAIVLGACVVSVAAINHRIFSDWSGFVQGLHYELNHIVVQHFGGTTMNRPNLFLAKGLVRETMPHVLVLAAIYLISLALFMKRTNPWDLFFVLFAGFFAVLLSFSNIPGYRYNLPTIVMLNLMAVLGIVRLSEFFQARFRWVVVVVALALIVPIQLRRCLNYLDQFANDSRIRLRRFVAHELPSDSVIVSDSYALPGYDDDPHLTGNEHRLPMKLYDHFWAADYADLQSLPGLGSSYVAVSELAYGRFFDPEVVPAPHDLRYATRRRFYEQLFASGQLLWSSDPDPPNFSFVNPAVRLYRLPAKRSQ